MCIAVYNAEKLILMTAPGRKRSRFTAADVKELYGRNLRRNFWRDWNELQTYNLHRNRFI